MYICITPTLDIFLNADYIRSNFCHRIHANEFMSSFALPVFLFDIYQNDIELIFVLKTVILRRISI